MSIGDRKLRVKPCSFQATHGCFSRRPLTLLLLPSLLLLLIYIYTYHCGVVFGSPRMERYLSVRPAPHSDEVILTPKSINPKADDTKEVLELKLQGRNYIRCNALTKKPKHTKRRTSPIWLWGEDLQLKESDGSTTYYFYYLCEKFNKLQELPIVLTGRSTALTYLIEDHNMDKTTGLLKKQGDTA